MDRMCIRCARLGLHPQRSLYATAQSGAQRNFATTIQRRADDSSVPRQPSKSPTRSQPRVQNKVSSNAAPVNSPPRSGLIIRRVDAPESSQNRRAETPPSGTLLRRSPQSSQSGQLLRRTGPPRQGAPAGASSRGGGNMKGRQRRKRTVEGAKAREEEEELATGEEIEAYMTKYIDPPANPTEAIEYKPKPQEMIELEKDWPNTPLSPTGLSASLIQKIEWLSRRLPHGYKTPGQLAEHFQKGNFTRFESEEEKQQVLKLAAELAQKRASKLSERKGSEVAAEDMGFSELVAKDDSKKLMNQVVKGEIGELERQRMPFLESVMRNLRNNGTYYKADTDKFMATVQKLMPAQAQRRPQPAQKKA